MRGVVAGLALALLVAGCGAGTHHGPRRSGSTATTRATIEPLTVRPPAPTVRSRVTFSFKATSSSGHQGPTRLTFTLSVAGPRRSGCLGPRTVAVPDVVKGATARATLAGGWCVGRYTAQVQEYARPYCKPGQMCPQYIRLVGTVARATFRVAAG